MFGDGCVNKMVAKKTLGGLVAVIKGRVAG